MGIISKVAFATLVLGLICSSAPAQAPPQNPPAPQPGTSQQVPPNVQPNGPIIRRGFVGPNGAPNIRAVGPRFRRSPGQGFLPEQGGFGIGEQRFGAAAILNDPAIRQRLGITSEQTVKIRQQDSDFRKSEIRNRADLEVKRIELNDLLAANNPDRAAINAKLQEVSAAQLASEKSAIDYRLALRDILTPAQRQQLQQLREGGPLQRNAPQPPPPGARGGRGPGQPGIPPPPNQRGQGPANQ